MRRFVRIVAVCSLMLTGCVGYLSTDGESDEGDPSAEDSSGSAGSNAPGSDERACEPVARGDGPIIVRRLTVDEYIETVRQTTGVEIASEARNQLPEEVRADGFRNTSYSLTVDIGHVEAYAGLAREIVDRLDAAEYVAERASCRELTESCFRTAVTEVGKWLFRGPVPDKQVENLLEIYESVQNEGGDFEEAASYLLRGMLQSPNFLYRLENQREGESPQRAEPYELASRLSYFVWGGPPDKALMEAAEEGELSSPTQLVDQVERMLNDPRADKSLRRFVYDWLSLGRLESVERSEERFPGWSDELAEDMEQETLTFVEHLVRDREKPLRALFDAEVTFATPELADHYGLESKGEGMEKYDLGEVPERGGLLTHGSLLTIGGPEASTVSRGLFLLREVLCGDVGSPPPDVDTTPTPTEPGRSQRQIAEARLSNPSCGGCHAKFEPLSFGLGKFNGAGRHVDVDEHGNELRDDGTLNIPESSKSPSYSNSEEMMELLAGSERVEQCMTRKVTQFAIGRKLTANDECILRSIRRKFREGGGTYASLVAAIVTSDLFVMKQTSGGQP